VRVDRAARLRTALALNIALVAAQVVAGIAAHSLGLLADAGHNLTDAAAVVVSLIAVRFARRVPTAQRTFGYHRGTILAAQANAAAILGITALVGYEAIRRLLHAPRVDGGIVVAVAAVAVAANLLAARLLHEPHRDHQDLNMRSASLHMLSDAAAAAGVLAAGIAIAATGRFFWLDPAASLAIAVLIAARAVELLRQTADVLLESTPEGLVLADVAAAIEAVDGVDEVHDLHVWSLSSDIRALSGHIVLSGHPSLEEAQATGETVKRAIGPRFAIAHATLELECESCVDEGEDPCGMDDTQAASEALHRH